MKKSIFAYTQSEADFGVLQGIADLVGVSIARRGQNLSKAVTDAAEWRIIPDIIIVDVDGVDDPCDALKALASSGPEIEVVLVAIGSRNDVAFARKLRARGVHDYIVKPLDGESTRDVVISALRQSSGDAKRSADRRVTLVTGVRRGVGVSTVAAMLAKKHSDEGRKTLLLDLDVAAGVQYLIAFGDQTTALCDVIRNPERIDAVLLAEMIRRGNANWSYLSMNGLGACEVEKTAVHALLHYLAQTYDSVIIDLPYNVDVVRSLAPTVDATLVLSPPTIFGLRDTKEFFEAVQVRQNTALVVNDSNDLFGGNFALPLSAFAERVPCSVFLLGFASDDLSAFLSSGGSHDIMRKRIGDELETVTDSFAKLADWEIKSKPETKKIGILSKLFRRKGMA